MKEIKEKTVSADEKQKEDADRRLGRQLLEERRRKYKKPRKTEKERDNDIELKMSQFSELLKGDDPNLTWVKETKLKFKKEDMIIPEFDNTEVEDQYISYDPLNHKNQNK